MTKKINTVQKAWEIAQKKSDERFVKICHEYDTAFCFRTVKKHRLFVMKDDGTAFWEEELPKGKFPRTLIRLDLFK